MVDAILGTTRGVLRLHEGALEPLGLAGHSVTALHASDAMLLAGTYGDGLFRSADGGRSWERCPARRPRHPNRVTHHGRRRRMLFE